MDVALEPSQPDPVVEAVESALAGASPAPDPWWRAGIDEALGE